MLIRLSLFLWGIFLVLTSSCEVCTVRQGKGKYPVLVFKKKIENTFFTVDTAFVSVYPQEAPAAILYNITDTVRNFFMPLKPDSDTLVVLFQSVEGTRKITLTYNRSWKVLSPDCGAELIFSDLNFVPELTDFDSVGIIDPFIFSNNAPNIEVFVY